MIFQYLASLLLSTQVSRVSAGAGSSWDATLFGDNLCGGSDSRYSGEAITQCANISGIYSFDGGTGDGTSTDVDICFYTEENCAGGPAIMSGTSGYCGCPDGSDDTTTSFLSWCVSDTGECPNAASGYTAGCN